MKRMSAITVMDDSSEPDILSNETSDSEDVIITMTTKKRSNKRRKNVKESMESECVIMGCTKRRKRAVNNDDCKISHVSRDLSRDQDILYVCTNKPPPMRKESDSPCTSLVVSSTSISTLTTNPHTACHLTQHTTTTGIQPPHTETSITRQHKDKQSTTPLINHSDYRPLNPELRSSGRTSNGNDEDASVFSIASSAPYTSTLDPPPWWTTPSSETTTSSKFTMVPLNIKSTESCLVAYPLKRDGFKVSLIQRIQSLTLWRRYIGEARLFLEERGANANLNEKLLYHCSRTNKDVICSEGLDMRLSNQGLFGRGIYFSNKPKKCDRYGSRSSKSRHMYACKVILGDVKSYPKGTSDNSLTREPQKPNGSYYDSVLGFMSVGEEFVIYNNYRAIPLYYIEYSHR